MRRANRLEIEMHAAVELVLGTALITLPFLLGLSGAAIILGIGFGGALVGLALTGYEHDGRGGLSLAAHAAFDHALAGALFVAALALGISDGSQALVLFLAAGAAHVTLSASTRYSPRRI